MRLKDKIAIVTGGAKGLGEAMSVLFVKEGAKVIAADLIGPVYTYEGVENYQLDVTDKEACRKLVEYAIERYGRIDILVNNAGITRDGLTRNMTDEMWSQVIDVNLNGIFNLTRYVGPHMQGLKSGSIVNVSSVVGEYGNIGQANYAATKAAVFGLTKSWAKEFAMKGGNVRVNAVAPGYTLTDIVKTVPQKLLDEFAAKTMLGRLGQPQEIAKAVLFLASEDASYITGQILSVNGGMRL